MHSVRDIMKSYSALYVIVEPPLANLPDFSSLSVENLSTDFLTTAGSRSRFIVSI